MKFLNRKSIGNLLIVGSLLMLIYTYTPLLLTYFPSKQSQDEDYLNTEFSIEIPKIKADAPIIENVDPWNEREYQQALKKGVALAKGFATPDMPNGLIYLFAHSSLPPWEMTRTNTSFLRLSELKPGDEININFHGTNYIYKVTMLKEIWPSQTEEIFKSQNANLVLQTCTPLGTSLKRLLVFAKQQP